MDTTFIEGSWWYEQTWGWKLSPEFTIKEKELHIKIHEDFLLSKTKFSYVQRDYIKNKVIYLPFNYENNKLILYPI